MCECVHVWRGRGGGGIAVVVVEMKTVIWIRFVAYFSTGFDGFPAKTH